MAKSMRSKREKRLRAIRREIVEPLYEKKESAKLAAQEAALAAPKLPVRSQNNNEAATSTEMTSTVVAAAAATETSFATDGDTDVEMAEGNQSMRSLKPTGKIGKKLRKKIKMGRKKQRGKGKIRKKRV